MLWYVYVKDVKNVLLSLCEVTLKNVLSIETAVKKRILPTKALKYYSFFFTMHVMARAHCLYVEKFRQSFYHQTKCVSLGKMLA